MNFKKKNKNEYLTLHVIEAAIVQNRLHFRHQAGAIGVFPVTLLVGAHVPGFFVEKSDGEKKKKKEKIKIQHSKKKTK